MSRQDIEVSDKESRFIEMNNKRGNSANNKSRQSYMSEPNVKEFNNAIRQHSMKIGRPYAFKDVDSLQQELTDYFDLCDRTDTVPTIVAIALYLGVNRDTIYAHANNPNSPFSDILKNVINYCHMTMENGALVGKINPVTYIFLGKNYFSLTDSKDINIKPSSDQPQLNSQETMSAIQKQLEEESTPNADYTEK